MKRIIALIITLCLCAVLCACDGAEIVENSFRFKRIDYNEGSVIVDTETGVMYLWVKSGYGGGLSVMVDQDGKPLIWEGEDTE